MKAFYIVLLALTIAGCGGSSQSSDGDKAFANSQYKKAVQLYDQELKTNSNDVKALYNRGRALEELKRYEEAELDFLKVLEL